MTADFPAVVVVSGGVIPNGRGRVTYRRVFARECARELGVGPVKLDPRGINLYHLGGQLAGEDTVVVDRGSPEATQPVSSCIPVVRVSEQPPLGRGFPLEGNLEVS